MLITDKFVFIHDPKQGGSFVTKSLFQIYGANWNIFKHLQAIIFRRIRFQSKYGELIMLSLKHAGCKHIPAQFQDRQILTTVRNPYDWYVSQYEFGWWKNKSLLKYFQVVPNFTQDYPHFPNLNFAEFIKLTDQAFDVHFDCPKEVWSQFGWRTRSFVDYYFKHPATAFPRMLVDNYIESNSYKDDLYNGLHFLRTKNLNQNLYDFLLANDYHKTDIEFILEMKKVLPLGKGRTDEQKWEQYFTPELKAEIRRKDRILFEMFPEFDV